MKLDATLLLAALPALLAPANANPLQQRMDLAEKPAWLSLGVELKATFPARGEVNSLTFRPANGGAKVIHSTSVEVNGRRLTARKEAEPSLYGASLNPAGDRLILDCGWSAYHVGLAALHEKESEIGEQLEPLPDLSYGQRPRFKISEWVWLTDSQALGRGAIETEDQGSYREVGLFLFDIASETLHRVRLADIELGSDPWLSIEAVSPEARVVRLHVPDPKADHRVVYIHVPEIAQPAAK